MCHIGVGGERDGGLRVGVVLCSPHTHTSTHKGDTMEQWFLVDKHRAEEFEWHIVDLATLLAAIKADAVVLPKDWKIIYGTIKDQTIGEGYGKRMEVRKVRKDATCCSC